MSVFGSIMSAIFGGQASAAQPAQPTGTSSASPTAGGTGSQAGNSTPAQGTGGASGSAAAAASGASGGASGQPVDVAAVLTRRASQKGEQLDWRRSIVDLMKLLDLDSSLSARKALAQELHYTGETSDSASMNIWLHKQVMQKLAENGGTVPQELRH